MRTRPNARRTQNRGNLLAIKVGESGKVMEVLVGKETFK